MTLSNAEGHFNFSKDFCIRRRVKIVRRKYCVRVFDVSRGLFAIAKFLSFGIIQENKRRL